MKVAQLANGEPELFYTIQGEGLNTGRPSVFLRLSLCNLHCTWCDTPYTWNWENTPHPPCTSGLKYKKSEQIIELSVEQLLPLLLDTPCRNLVLTGGEPLIQQKELAKLIEALSDEWQIEIETNGTIIPDALPNAERAIQYNVSPKLPHSGNDPGIALKSDELNWFAQYPKASFKFVISQPDDLQMIKTLQQEHGIINEQVILMPEGTLSDTIRQKTLPLVEICLREGYRFSDRLHVHIWGSERAK